MDAIEIAVAGATVAEIADEIEIEDHGEIEIATATEIETETEIALQFPMHRSRQQADRRSQSRNFGHAAKAVFRSANQKQNPVPVAPASDRSANSPATIS